MWWVERRSFLVVSSENQRSINRPWVVSSEVRIGRCSLEPLEVALDAGDDAGVAGDFGVPAAFGGVVAERGDVGELGLRARG